MTILFGDFNAKIGREDFLNWQVVMKLYTKLGMTMELHNVWSFRAADCDVDLYLVAAKIKDRIVVIRQGSHKFHMERCNLKKLNEARRKKEVSCWGLK
jgi:hypothetical protein